MVRQSKSPKKIWHIHARSPPKIIHRIFKGIRMQPEGVSDFFISAPNGHKQSNPNLKVCIAMGMPMMVHANAKLPVKYPIADSIPPKIHQIMLPRNFIFLYNIFQVSQVP